MPNPSTHQHQALQAQAQAAHNAEEIVQSFVDLVSSQAGSGRTLKIDDKLLRRALIAAVRAYSAKIESEDLKGLPLDFRSVTATEAVTAIVALMRSADLNLLDMAMWYHRPLDAQTAERQNLVEPAEQVK